jgi:hypothetical protein
MVWRDIDFTVVCQSLDKRPVLAAATELAARQDVKTMQFRDDSGRFNQDPDKYPDGLYIESPAVEIALPDDVILDMTARGQAAARAVRGRRRRSAFSSAGGW